MKNGNNRQKAYTKPFTHQRPASMGVMLRCRRSKLTRARDRNTSPTFAIPLYRKIKTRMLAVTTMVGFVTALMTMTYVYLAHEDTFVALYDRFNRNIHQTDEWSGVFDGSPADIYANSYNLSEDSALKLELYVEPDGSISGIAYFDAFCQSSIYTYHLVKGQVSMFGKSARMTIYDIVAGRDVNYAELSAVKDGYVLSISQTAGFVQIPDARLGRDPFEADSTPKGMDMILCPNFLSSTKHQYQKWLQQNRLQSTKK